MGIYALWGLGQTLFSLVNSVFLAHRGVHAARALHENMLSRIMKAPVAFFDATPRGRMVNRFTKDQATVDVYLMSNVSAFSSACFLMLSTTLLVLFNTPYTALTLVPLAFFFLRTQRRFRRTMRELKRFDAVTRSPIYSHFGEALEGMPTIRSFRAQPHMTDMNYRDIMNNQRFNYAILALNRWLAVRLELIGSIVVLSAGCFAVLQRQQLGAAALGLTLSQTFSITGLLGFLIRMTAELENAFTAVERINEYTGVPQEREGHALDAPAAWPSAGAVVFKGVEMRYRSDMAPSLKGLNFAIRPAEKIGVVGRTGAGKSSLLVCMYRLTELSAGSIKIDGVNIADLDLDTLRRAISIIPQDPTLFTGTIRYNLDPENVKTDDEIWAALRQANLSSYVEDLSMKLETQVGEGGSIFSVGGKQLLCLARALLRDARVIVIDEATANIDNVTDELIQQTIRTQFAQSTVITIAHRLNTIIDSDRVLVLDRGEVVQFDAPSALLKIPAHQPSIFRDLVEETGSQSARKLIRMASTQSLTKKLSSKEMLFTFDE